jgi:carboxymethylenebutenolidase
MPIARNVFWAPALLLVVAGALVAQQEYTQTRSSRERLAASPRSRTDVSVEYAGGRVKVATTEPRGSRRADVVIVIHTNRGLSDWARAVGDELAKEGYLSLVPDLLTGKGPRGGDTDSFESEDAVTKAIGSLDRDEVTTRLRAVVRHARSLLRGTGTVNVGGFCWGGTEAFRLATNEPSSARTFVFYGGPPPAADMARITSPVYGFYGESDARINETIEGARAQMKQAGKFYEPVVYQGVGHGFMQMGMGDRVLHDAAAQAAAQQRTAEAWQRWLKLLEMPPGTPSPASTAGASAYRSPPAGSGPAAAEAHIH